MAVRWFLSIPVSFSSILALWTEVPAFLATSELELGHYGIGITPNERYTLVCLKTAFPNKGDLLKQPSKCIDAREESQRIPDGALPEAAWKMQALFRCGSDRECRERDVCQEIKAIYRN